jgi:hypothetical protein
MTPKNMKLEDICENLAMQIFLDAVSGRRAIGLLSSPDASDMLKK